MFNSIFNFNSMIYGVARPIHNGTLVLVTWYRQRHVTILHCHWWKFSWRNTDYTLYRLYVIILSIISIKNAKQKLYQEQIWDSQAPVGYSSFQIDCVIVEYGLFNTTNCILNLIYIRFGVILTQFYINFSRQEHQIDVICIVQRALSYSTLFSAYDSL